MEAGKAWVKGSDKMRKKKEGRKKTAGVLLTRLCRRAEALSVGPALLHRRVGAESFHRSGHSRLGDAESELCALDFLWHSKGTVPV